MASISFPVTGVQPIPRDQPASAPAGTGGPHAVDPNQQDAPQGDTVTISATFPPAQPAQQATAVKIQEFSVFVALSESQAGQAAATGPAPAAAPADTSPQPSAQTIAADNALAAATTLDPATAAASAAATASGPAATPQQELAQLDQTLQQLGVDPQSISLFNRIGLLLYANDPTALADLVKALQAVDQQLGQLNGATNTTTQPQTAAQALLQNANQPQTQPLQGIAQFRPEPLTHIKGTTPAQPQGAAPTPAQLEGQNQNPAGNAAGTVFAAQLSFTDVQASFQEQSTSQQGSSSNQSSGNGATGPSSAQTNNLLVNFQELQLSFQQVEIQTPQQQTPGGANSSTQGQGKTLNINA